MANPSAFKAVMLASGRMSPRNLPPVTTGESVKIDLKLKPALSGATISSATWASNPVGLTFASTTTTGDTNTTASATVSGFQPGEDYIVTATATLSDSLTRIASVRIRSVDAGGV